VFLKLAARLEVEARSETTTTKTQHNSKPETPTAATSQLKENTTISAQNGIEPPEAPQPPESKTAKKAKKSKKKGKSTPAKELSEG